MRSRYKFDPEYSLYFASSTIVEFIPVFTSEKYFSIIIDSFTYCRHNKGIKIFAYVIMDNHFHLILSGTELSATIASLKGYTARKIIDQLKIDQKVWLLNQLQYYKKKYKKDSTYQVWQEGVHPQAITSLDIMEQKLNYIHFNPVRKGLVRKPEHWKYSSAIDYFTDEQGVLEIDRFEE